MSDNSHIAKISRFKSAELSSQGDTDILKLELAVHGFDFIHEENVLIIYDFSNRKLLEYIIEKYNIKYEYLGITEVMFCEVVKLGPDKTRDTWKWRPDNPTNILNTTNDLMCTCKKKPDCKQLNKYICRVCTAQAKLLCTICPNCHPKHTHKLRESSCYDCNAPNMYSNYDEEDWY